MTKLLGSDGLYVYRRAIKNGWTNWIIRETAAYGAPLIGYWLFLGFG
jgi:hypothetical protein